MEVLPSVEVRHIESRYPEPSAFSRQDLGDRRGGEGSEQRCESPCKNGPMKERMFEDEMGCYRKQEKREKKRTAMSEIALVNFEIGQNF